MTDELIEKAKCVQFFSVFAFVALRTLRAVENLQQHFEFFR